MNDNVIGLIGILVVIFLIVSLFTGAVALLKWAGESGFIGVAVYFACWVFLFPLMLAGCIIAGVWELWERSNS